MSHGKIRLSVTLVGALNCNSLQAQAFQMDFDSQPDSLEFYGSSAWQMNSENGNGYLSITNAVSNQRGAIVFPDFTDGEPLYDFTFKADVRIGGGTERPGEGFSINFVHPNDPVLEDGDGWSWSGPGHTNLPEEGTTTGLAVGFDEASETATDVIGVGIRSNNALFGYFELPELNGDIHNLNSLQTGPSRVDGEDLPEAHDWAPLEIDYCNGFVSVFYKNNPVDGFGEFLPVGSDLSLSRLVLGGRTGSLTSNHHFDNVSLRRNEPRGCHFDGGPFSAGGINAIGVLELEGNITNQKLSPNQPGAPGFRVKLVETDVTVDNHTIAEEVLRKNDGATTVASYRFVDLGGVPGAFSKNTSYPNGVADASMSDFVVEAMADVTIPAGSWSIGLGTDDGGKIRIEGVTFEDSQSNDSLSASEIRFEGNRGHSWTVGTFTLKEPLTTTITGTMHERAGGDSFEIAVLNDAVVEDANPDSGWELLADGIFGWEVTHFGNALVHADIEARPRRGLFYPQFDVDGDAGQTDILRVENPDEDIYTTVLQLEDYEFFVNGYGAIAKGDRFSIFDADEIAGTPVILSAVYHQHWTFDGETKEIVFGGAGDLNSDHSIDFKDVDFLLSQVVTGANRPTVDLTGDRFVDADDIRLLVTSPLYLNSYIGDANGDGEFSSADLVKVFQADEYEDDVARNSSWETGDWNGDKEFDSGDMIFAFQNGGYEAGPRAPVAKVPETTAIQLLVACLSAGAFFRRFL